MHKNSESLLLEHCIAKKLIHGFCLPQEGSCDCARMIRPEDNNETGGQECSAGKAFSLFFT